jgi:hypothetical protein
MISNTDSTLLIYFTEHIRVKAYTRQGGPGNGFSRRAGMHRPMRFWRVRFRALRAPAASSVRDHPGMPFGFLRNKRSASPESPITTQGPSRLLRALKRTRAPLTAFGMTIRFSREFLVHATIPAGVVGMVARTRDSWYRIPIRVHSR